MATVGEGWPVSVTVRLDHPTIIDDQ